MAAHRQLLFTATFAFGFAGLLAAPLQEADLLLPMGIPDVPPFGLHTTVWSDAIFMVNAELGSWAPPMPVRLENMIDSATWDCIAAFHPSWMGALVPGERPIVGNVPPTSQNGFDLYTSDARLLCALGSYSVLYPKIVPNSVDAYADYLADLGITQSVSELVLDEIAQCLVGESARSCVEAIAAAEDFSPAVVGAIIGAFVIEYLKDDGWNSEGLEGKDGTECTANCKPYSDTSNFYARNFPGPKGLATKWEPLLTFTDRAFYFRQEHTVPHLGFKGKPRAITPTHLALNLAKNPKYDYEDEVELVLERTRNLDDENKMIVEYMDNKRNLAMQGLTELYDKFPGQMSFEVAALYFVGLTAAEHDAVLMAWRSKATWNLVRPTTLIKELGNQLVESYAGPDQGVAVIKGQDWEPYILVQPHSEFPSGSSCLCTGALGITDNFISWQLGDETSIPFHMNFPAGSSAREPGMTPANEINVVLADYTEVRDVCAQSRLDGGMHFTTSIFASMELCSEVGDFALDYVKSLVGGTPI